jgi:uncharacterized protein YktB (UPF0637 family)
MGAIGSARIASAAAPEADWKHFAVSGLGFTHSDFLIFTTEDFSARMQQILDRLQPKIGRLGRELAPELGRVMQADLYVHVARHAHQSTNPRETWVAWGPSPKGYTRHGFLALSISRAGLHARAAVRVQADHRAEMGRRIAAGAGELAGSLGRTRIARYEDWQSDAIPPARPADSALFASLAEELARKTGAIDVGFGWPVAEALRLDRADLIDAFRELEPLYRILRGGG